MLLRINSDAIVKHAATLERLHRSAMPVAVRNTLNSAAFDVKKTTMPAQAGKQFIHREKNFFKANSRVQMAQGFKLSAMKATVGFVSLGGTNHAVDDLQQQEHGGTIGGRTFIPLAQARTGGSWRRKPRRNARISDIKNIVDAKDGNGKNEKEQFIRSCIHAGVGGWVLGNRENTGGNRILYQVRSLVKKGNQTIAKVVPMFAVKTGRKVKPQATHFMHTASMQSGGKMEGYFKQHAEKQIQKYRNK